MGMIYYTVTTTSLMTLFHFIFRLKRIPNPKAFLQKRVMNKGLITFYSLLNLFIFYYFFNNKVYGYMFFLINESVTIGVSYLFLSGFYVYGITGQICSGKTSACEYLKRRYGAVIINFDDLNREVLEMPSTIKQIRETFGLRAISFDNEKITVNKSNLKKIIFEDKNKRKQLEGITHKKVFLLFFKKFFMERFFYQKRLIFIENSLLLRFNIFNVILKGIVSICVSDENILIQRIMKRDNNNKDKIVSEETAKNILKNQPPLSTYRLKSDVVIYNDDNYQGLELKIDQLMRDILKGTENDNFYFK